MPSPLAHPLLMWLWGLPKLDFTGLAFSALFFCWSLTPSLLPRDWLFQGLIGGINSAIGYGFGVAVGWLVLRVFLRPRSWWPLPPRAELGLKIFVPIVAVLASLVMLAYSAGWQRELAALMDAEGTTTTGYLRTGALSIATAALLISAIRVLRDFVRLVVRQINKVIKMPREVANVIGVVLVVVLVVALVQGVLLRAVSDVTNSIFSLQNDETRDGAIQPTEPERSGSPQSAASWESLGFEGRNFVSSGMNADEMTRALGREAMEPIRAYAGLESADNQDERLDLVVDELERTGAFQRSALVVVPTTGTGWVNPTAIEAAELMFDGNVATVAAQYSYLPSWISFLAEREIASEAGKALIDKVHDRWLQEPEATRPKFYVYGESLGTNAGEGAFDGVADIRDTTDGVLWVGPPNANRLWSQFVDRRDPGSPEVLPVYSDGLVLRFADNSGAIPPADQPWYGPRVLYVQHASDPVVWWSPDLLFERPDWLSEAPGPDRLPDMRWFPIVTFWQVAADLTNAAGVPDGHGHNYGTLVLDGWVSIAAPDGWTAADTERVRAVMDAYKGKDGPEK
ncbi:alpha/beta hydrolase [Rhodococcus sp. H36-A4]|uniref:alpha/beta hydrolase n=1 Tax=Rhodococcus sp. H36-A4 TaxID=3004353 RepID=UPI0022AFCC80|nr:alpha/beta hydrolase [Rhodococcus sp. H36-A4]MCZ4076725.1 alpha/beta hydrolase [Rhodococcus sp. H36-A4]